MTHHITDYRERAQRLAAYLLWISAFEGRTPPKNKIFVLRETPKDKRNRVLASFD